MTKFELIDERLKKVSAYIVPATIAPTVQTLLDDARWLRDEVARLRDYINRTIDQEAS